MPVLLMMRYFNILNKKLKPKEKKVKEKKLRYLKNEHVYNAHQGNRFLFFIAALPFIFFNALINTKLKLNSLKNFGIRHIEFEKGVKGNSQIFLNEHLFLNAT